MSARRARARAAIRARLRALDASNPPPRRGRRRAPRRLTSRERSNAAEWFGLEDAQETTDDDRR